MNRRGKRGRGRRGVQGSCRGVRRRGGVRGRCRGVRGRALEKIYKFPPNFQM